MYEIQMFDCRPKRLTWDDVACAVKGIAAAEKLLAEHEEDWPNCQFRIMRAVAL